MGTETTGGGSTTSFNNTPQATDNSYNGYEDYVFTFDVMADDLGGAAKILWSIDDSTMKDDSVTGSYDLLTADNTAAAVPEYSDLGARIWIQDGKIKYDTNALDWLSEGQTAYDRFTYAIRLSNGTLSWATVYVTLTGREDLPAIVTGGDGTGSVQEDVAVALDGKLHDNGSFGFTDVDLLDTHTVSVTANGSGYVGTLNAIVSDDSTGDDTGQINWRFGVDNSAVQYLGEGEALIQTYTVTVDDGHGGTASQTVTVTITGTNDAPVLTVDTSGGVTEDVGVVAGEVSDSGTLSFTDVDVNDSHTVSFVYNDDAAWSDGTLTADQITAITAGFDADSDSWDYSVANADLDFLGAGETITLSFDVTVTDDSGALNNSDTETVTITIHGTNDGPTVESAVADQHVDEDAAWTFTVPAGTFDDPDANDTLTYSATLANGDPLPAWLTFNAATQQFSGTPPADFNGTISLKVTASDGSLSVSDTFDLIVDPVNDAPVNTMPASYSTDEDTPKQLTGLSVADVDAGSGVIKVTLSVNSGTLAATAGGGVSVLGSGTGSIQLTGTLAAINAYLAGASAPVFTPAANANGDVTLTMTTTDQGNSGSGGAKIDTDSVTISVAAVNDAAVVTGDDAKSITEDAVPNTVSGNLDSTDVDGVNDSWQAQTIASVNGYGSLVINANGTWTYTLDNSNPTVNGLNDDSDPLTDTFTVKTADGTEHDITITINGHTDFIYVSPTPFTGTGDPNDFDSLGNAAGQNLSSTATNGDDIIYGGAGADTINAGGGNDTIYAGSGADSTNGGAENDRLFGGSGVDTIVGGNDVDVIIGGYGADILTGGNGADTFFYLSQRDTGDTIGDFSKLQGDKIKFDSSFGFDATDFMGVITTAGAVDPGKFGYMYDAGTNTTTIYVDTDGVFGADMEIKLTGNIALDSGDFLFGGL